MPTLYVNRRRDGLEKADTRAASSSRARVDDLAPVLVPSWASAYPTKAQRSLAVTPTVRQAPKVAGRGPVTRLGRGGVYRVRVPICLKFGSAIFYSADLHQFGDEAHASGRHHLFTLTNRRHQRAVLPTWATGAGGGRLVWRWTDDAIPGSSAETPTRIKAVLRRRRHTRTGLSPGRWHPLARTESLPLSYALVRCAECDP